MKPHEETWRVVKRSHDSAVYVSVDDPKRGEVDVAAFLPEHYDESMNPVSVPQPAEPRAKLAAQAPAMARLLISLREAVEGYYAPEMVADINKLLKDAGVLDGR